MKLNYEELLNGFNELQDKYEKTRNHTREILKVLQHKERELKKCRDKVRSSNT